jgi:hypothetical protein
VVGKIQKKMYLIRKGGIRYYIENRMCELFNNIAFTMPILTPYLSVSVRVRPCCPRPIPGFLPLAYAPSATEYPDFRFSIRRDALSWARYGLADKLDLV